jgi:hypothetical protein
MFTADNNRPSFDELAGVHAAFVLRISITTLRQVECHVR